MPRHAYISTASELSDEDLEQYLLGHIREEAELLQVEKHLVACPECAQRAAAMADYIATMRKALRQFANEAGGNSH